MNKRDLIDIRYGKYPADFDFIEATWKQALYYGDKCLGCIDAECADSSCKRKKGFWNQIDKQSFYKNYALVIGRILNRPDLKIAIACLKEDPTFCLAYAISQAETLHFVYTKKDWRKIGLMNDLVPLKVHTITHLTETGKDLWKKKWPDAKFNPFA